MLSLYSTIPRFRANHGSRPSICGRFNRWVTWLYELCFWFYFRNQSPWRSSWSLGMECWFSPVIICNYSLPPMCGWITHFRNPFTPSNQLQEIAPKPQKQHPTDLEICAIKIFFAQNFRSVGCHLVKISLSQILSFKRKADFLFISSCTDIVPQIHKPFRVLC